MKLCPNCNAPVTAGRSWYCSACDHEPPRVEGILAFAPELSDTMTGFDPDAFENLEALEAGSFWFNSRNTLILHALQKYAPGAQSMLEIGCGTGFVLGAVADAFPHLTLTGSELHASGLRVAKQRLDTKADFLQLDARRLPFREEFDVIGAFDVLEHIAEDESVIRAVRDAMRPDGIFLATVPQHPSLWSPSDDLAHHVRRYRVGELDRKVRACGLSIMASTSFVSLLMPALVASRLVARQSDHYDAEREMRPGTLTDRVATWVMSVERALIRAGLRFPVGGSRLLIARRSG